MTTADRLRRAEEAERRVAAPAPTPPSEPCCGIGAAHSGPCLAPTPAPTPDADNRHEAHECDEEAYEREAQTYKRALYECQVALDMRCVDNPSKVGCDDTLLDVPRVLAERLRAAESALSPTKEDPDGE